MKVLVFGTGRFYQNRKTEACFKKTEIIGFVDNDQEKQNILFEGLKVYSPECIDKLQFDYIVLMLKDVSDVYKQLRELFVAEDKILSYADFCRITDLDVKEATGNNDELLSSGLKVSVIIPNYNYSHYLPQRIYEIACQTHKPSEILFLDDCSTDDSLKVAENELQKYDVPYRIIPNAKNAGCFSQWLKGIRLSKNELVWIAEADDMCELSFLETSIPAFLDEEVSLSYVQSEVIDENGIHSGFIYTDYTKQLDEIKWTKDYVNDGKHEILSYLAIMNTIPNASGVVFRKSAFDGIDEFLPKYKMCGDWFAYIYALGTGKIAFSAKVQNYHRRHSMSIINREERNIDFILEQLDIKEYLATKYIIPERIRDVFVQHVLDEYERLYGESWQSNETVAKKAGEVLEQTKKCISQFTFAQNVPRKRILFVIPDFEMGGGQTLIIRLANYMCRYHQVFLYNARPYLAEKRIEKMIMPGVTVLESEGTPENLAYFIKKHDIDIVNSHIWWADKITYKALSLLPFNHVKYLLCMHGCYEMLINNLDVDCEFECLYKLILKRADNIIIGSEKNREIFNHVYIDESKISRVYYGYELQNVPQKKMNELTTTKEPFVVGLVARGIREKGFEEAIIATISVKEIIPELELVLVGNGPFIDELKAKYAANEFVHFIDDLKKPSEWIGWVKNFEIGLLPTYFASETLPNTIIEYLAYGVPVISTDIGDIKNMIISEKKAGVLLELKNGKPDVRELADAIKSMYFDKEKYAEYKANTKLLFEQFKMERFVEAYYHKMI
ncbi:Glycosyltransferase involved in cell wall bisynthesis [Pseudobutyrivibrio sp. C4]|uniref:glycosyltransferase n=1 Tax=Pseudobutyrivibrio sp. C4 TaxID=1520803 RepID=UPI0008CEA0CE|nr:glycosyltransferase [Pseudobutyrivibrio sp. C4]SET25408.1 Glycosyltransferase involved in cell wall bisynthesis [Pseudobutyrivibrio sp. C4]